MGQFWGQADTPAAVITLLASTNLAFRFTSKPVPSMPSAAPMAVGRLGLIRRVGAGPRGAKPYEITDAGLEEVRQWMRAGGPDRPVRSAAALRIFFLWPLEPDEAADYLRSEVERQQALLAEYKEIEKEDVPDARKQRAFRIALEGGLRVTRLRIEYLEWAIEEVATWGLKPATLEP